MRINESGKDVQHLDNTVANDLKLSAEAWEALNPAKLWPHARRSKLAVQMSGGKGFEVNRRKRILMEDGIGQQRSTRADPSQLVGRGAAVGRRALLLGAAASMGDPWVLSPALATTGQAPRMTFAVDRGGASSMPFACFGVQIYSDAVARELTLQALDAGFRCFFTSPEAGNQLGFAKAIRDSGVPRSELFIAGSVLSDDAEGYRAARATTKQRCDESLQALSSGGVGELDLLLLERPGRDCAAIRGQWAALEEVRRDAPALSLGTCNFDLEQLDCLSRARVRPAVNQIQYTLAIRMPHDRVRAEHERRGLRLMAFSPLGGPDAILPRSIRDECAAIGKAHGGRSSAQVALRWLVQQDIAFSIHSRNRAHLREDLSVFDFALTDAEMARLTRLSEEAPAYY